MPTADPKRRWTRTGGGIHRIQIDGVWKNVRKGKTITCTKAELGTSTSYKALDPEPPELEPTIGLKVKHRAGGFYDVINLATGDPINDKALRKPAAEALAKAGPPDSEQADPSPTAPPDRPTAEFILLISGEVQKGLAAETVAESVGVKEDVFDAWMTAGARDISEGNMDSPEAQLAQNVANAITATTQVMPGAEVPGTDPPDAG